jgi:CRISPR/Cas system-associated exonuclease Cas4 (RecB family)
MEEIREKIKNSKSSMKRPNGDVPISDKELWAESETERIQSLLMYHSVLVDFEKELEAKYESQVQAQNDLKYKLSLVHKDHDKLEIRKERIMEKHKQIHRQHDVIIRKLEERQKVVEYEKFYSEHYWPMIAKVVDLLKGVQYLRTPHLSKIEQQNREILKVLLDNNEQQLYSLKDRVDEMKIRKQMRTPKLLDIDS